MPNRPAGAADLLTLTDLVLCSTSKREADRGSRSRHCDLRQRWKCPKTKESKTQHCKRTQESPQRSEHHLPKTGLLPNCTSAARPCYCAALSYQSPLHGTPTARHSYHTQPSCRTALRGPNEHPQRQGDRESTWVSGRTPTAQHSYQTAPSWNTSALQRRPAQVTRTTLAGPSNPAA